MGRSLTKMMILVLTPILLLHLLISASSGAAVKKPNETRVYISEGERFSPYESQGKTPKSADSDVKVLHGKTCCSASQMQTALSSSQNMATYKEDVILCLVLLALEEVDTCAKAFKDCFILFELLECLICHRKAETKSGTLRNCASSCDKVLEAYFSRNANNQIRVLSGENEGGFFICGKASKWESNDTTFRDAAGFTIQTADDSVEESCYRSKSSVETLVESLRKTENITWFQDLQKLVRERFLVFAVYVFFRLCSQLCLIYGIARLVRVLIRDINRIV